MDLKNENLIDGAILIDMLGEGFLEELEDKYNPFENDNVIEPMVIESMNYLHQQGVRRAVSVKLTKDALSSYFSI